MAVTSTTIKTNRLAWLEGIEKITNNFLLRRIVKALFTIWVVTSITFFVVRAMPGSAVDILIQDLTAAGYSPDDAKNQAASLMSINLDAPAHEQYLEYVGNVLQGDLGKSFKSRGLNVSDIIAGVLPWTIFSVGLSLVITFTLGIALGAVMAYARDTWIDHLLSNLAAILDAISPYIIGLLAILFLSVLWKIVPIMETRGAMSPGMQPEFSFEFFADIFSHVKVLAFVYVLSSIGSWMLIMKSNTITTLGEDYVTVARARGLPDLRILSAYVGRNATLPLFTRLAITIGFAVSGSVLLESLFTYRGIGYQLWQAISGRDYPVMQGIFIVVTAAVVFANLIADLLYGWLDPRIRIVGGSS
ncbi:MAG: ABC transporter permease [Chloroflexi bacterium]|nr:ABC transporter permease [Chloroflexota bacterium]